MDAPSLEKLQARLDKALSNLFCAPLQGGWNKLIFKIPFSANLSMILMFLTSRVIWVIHLHLYFSKCIQSLYIFYYYFLETKCTQVQMFDTIQTYMC